MSNAFLEIIRGDGSCERHPLEGERITVGSDVSATITLVDSPELEPMHLLLSPREDGCWVSTAREPQCTTQYSGKPFENGVVPWGSELDCGMLVFRLARAEAKEAKEAKRGRMRLYAPVVLLAALAFGAFIMLRPQEPQGPGRARAEAPTLFGEQQSTTKCRSAKREAAIRARDALSAADAKLDRYLFDPYDGVVAVSLYREAAACARLSGNKRAARDADNLGAGAAERVGSDYLFHRLRLERAIEAKNYRTALAEVSVVRSMLRDHEGEYVDWLVRARRILEIRIVEEEKKD